ncbi:hypothetical protein AMAG_00044 [Allomyces macrogynus ATCC 38327]|uniref:Uncharacterized protein n=1 Tax=Allomyces macrogynus (strain ATCC 38327) TaxID=578462 RepID=A0A0L0RVE4_ALLM3|nr:hypothetical protein AMAG_00044 [Allomyces macrogynus ATCC 38327]|eukprot:KNE54041.1 hypothetical protein AMAG_00044 [Allomyces macrogynus ATCC 38327]
MRIAATIAVLFILAIVITAIVLVATAREPVVWVMSIITPAGSWSLQERDTPNPVAVASIQVSLAVNNPNSYDVDIRDMTISTTDRRLNVSWPLTQEWAGATLVKGLIDCGVEATKLPAYLVGKVNNELSHSIVKIVMSASKVVGVFGVRAAKNPTWMSKLQTRVLLCPEQEDKSNLANLGYLTTLLNDAWHLSKNETGKN